MHPRATIQLPLSSLATIYFFASFGLLSLWDFYIGEIRVFDFLSVAMAILALPFVVTMRRGRIDIRTQSVTIALAVLVFVLVYALYGICIHPDNLKPSIGMLLGALVFVMVQCSPIRDNVIDRSLACIAAVHLTAFFFQMFCFYAFKETINFHSVFGLQPRLQSSVFRPAGLFLEPAIYCFFAGSIFLLRRVRENQYRFVDNLLLLSMALSLSLWGISISILFFTLFRFRLAALWFLVILFNALVFVSVSDFASSPIYRFLKMRVENLASDPSAQQRYGGAFGWTSEILADWTIVLGNGINNFFEDRGANGLAFIINSMGLGGSLLLFLMMFSFAPPRRWLILVVVVPIMLTAAPLWKIFYFWAWLGFLVKPLSEAKLLVPARARALI